MTGIAGMTNVASTGMAQLSKATWTGSLRYSTTAPMTCCCGPRSREKATHSDALSNCATQSSLWGPKRISRKPQTSSGHAPLQRMRESSRLIRRVTRADLWWAVTVM
jgi:hypothetical protein